MRFGCLWFKKSGFLSLIIIVCWKTHFSLHVLATATVMLILFAVVRNQSQVGNQSILKPAIEE